MRSVPHIFLCGTFFILLSGCDTLRNASHDTSGEITGSIASLMQEPGDVKYHASDESLRLARKYFEKGAYGTAERYFRDAVEKSPNDRAAWIGLAASYDRIGRFDFADKAYRAAIKLGGETPELLNNLGYSYMLRGDLRTARAKFNAALEQDPQNPTIRNNLELLNASYRYIERDPQISN